MRRKPSLSVARRRAARRAFALVETLGELIDMGEDDPRDRQLEALCIELDALGRNYEDAEA